MKKNYHLIALVILVLCNLVSTAQFKERAVEVGINITHKNANYIGGGVAIFDVNNDDLLDVFVVGGTESSAIFINNGETFDKSLVYLGIDDIDYYSYVSDGIAVGDVNNDGFDDLFICTQYPWPNILMINKHDNTFDVIPDSITGIRERSWTIGASFGDINKDGWLDLLVVNYILETGNYIDTATGLTVFNHKGFANQLYLNNKDNTFNEVSTDYGITKVGTTLACAMTDFDNDNDVDIYIANDFGHFIVPNELYENKYPEAALQDVSQSSGADIGLFAMGIGIGDYDNDLDLDYYVTNLGKNELLQNNGDKTFSLATNQAILGDSSVDEGLAVGWGTGFFDYDNDGWLDLYISNGFIPAAFEIYNSLNNPNALYKNNSDGTFTNVSIEMQIQDSAICRGSAYGDLDNDGDLDLIFVPYNTVTGSPSSGMRPNVEVYYNETENNNNWVKLKLQGVQSNRNGYGSHIILHDSEGNAQMREVDGGSSHASSNSSIVHFGLGSANIDSIEIYWISGKYKVIRDVEVNQQYTIVEDSSAILTFSLANTNDKIDLDVYPNPTNSRIVVWSNLDNKSLNDELHYQLIGINGSVMLNAKIGSFPFEIDLGTILPQNLILNIYSRKKLIASKEIIKL